MKWSWKVLCFLTFSLIFALTIFAQEGLKFEERVLVQGKVEKVLYENRIWPGSNKENKPSFEAIVTNEILSSKVKDYLKKEEALKSIWNVKISNQDVEKEVQRIFKNSKDRILLDKIVSSLDGNLFLFGECVAKPILIERKINQLYSSDQKIHFCEKDLANSILNALDNGDYSKNENLLEENVLFTIKGYENTSEVENGEKVVILDAREFETLMQRNGSKPFLSETKDYFEVINIISKSDKGINAKIVYIFKKPFAEWFKEVESKFDISTDSITPFYSYSIQESAPQTRATCPDNWLDTTLDDIPDPRYGHNAIWTGSEMIVWGGGFNSGAKYNPSTDSWTPLSRQSGVPVARSANTAVWTGTEMIVWGGSDGTTCLNSGGKYNPSTDSWTATSLTSPCPSVRKNHTAVWVPSYGMVVWGGESSDGTLLNDGAIYAPSTDTWSSLSSMGTVPDARRFATAVFDPVTSHLIVWGGSGAGDVPFNSGGQYDFTLQQWSATSTSGNCPSARRYHSVVMTGNEMIVWGGEGAGSVVLNSGGRYNPSSDTWATISTTNAPSARRFHTAVFTSSEMIVWGGENGTSSLQTGGKYDIAADSWSSTTTTSAPTARYQHTAVWTGTEMIIWGGYWPTNSGGRYNPSSNTWSATSLGTNVPAGRQYHTAVWTGTEMIVWGGESLGPTIQLNTGGKYNPATDSWSATSILPPCPIGRRYHTAIWTGTDMIIWGGNYYDGTEHQLDSGGLYNVATDIWSATTTSSGPTARQNHTAVWTETEMIVWGGFSGSSYLNTGGRYNPATNSWIATSTTSAPGSRKDHTAVWSGNVMIIWGGFNGSALSTGAMYNPTTNAWTTVSTSSAPTARYYHTAVWAEQIKSMVVWGGVNSNPFNNGGIYNPVTNKWTATSLVNVPQARKNHTAVWTGEEMIVFGGIDTNGANTDDGGRLNPYTNSWTTISKDPGYPTPRSLHTAIWTGQKMVVWGGSGAFSSGGVYEPPPQVIGYYEACGSGPVLLTTGTYSTYQWIKDDVDIVGATEQSYYATETGVYNVRVTLPDNTVCEGIPHRVDCWGYPQPTITGNSSGCATPGVSLTTATFTTYQWILDGTDISGATSQTYTAKTGGTYNVRVTDSHGCTGTSPNFTLTIHQNPTPTINGTQEGCPWILSTSLEYTTYQWKLGSTDIPGATSRQYVATANGSYTVVVTDENGCSGTSPAFSVSSYPAPTITGNTSGCEGGIVTLSTGAFVSYQWYLGGVPIGGATLQNYDATQSGSYTVEVTDANGCVGMSAAKAVTFYPPPVPQVTGDHGPACFSALSTTTTYSNYQWIKDSVDIPNATTRNYTAIASGTYQVRVTDSHGCIGTSEGFAVTIYDPPVPPSILGASSGCPTSGTLLNTQSYSTYQWYANGTAITGATSQSYQTTQSGFNYYTVQTTDIHGCSTQSSLGQWVNLDPPRPYLYQNTDNYFVTNGAVKSFASYENNLFIGGDFTYVGPYTGGVTTINPATGQRNHDFPKVQGTVYTVVSDGNGGYYIGGLFDRVGGYTRQNLAHINSDLSIDQDFAPFTDGAVWALYLSGTKLYVGGAFTKVNTVTRNRLAGLDTTTGQLTGFDPNVGNNIVYAMGEYSGKLIIGGSFTSVGGQTYNRLAQIDELTGIPTTWNPSINNIVYSLAVSGSTLYIGGSFTQASGATKNRMAAYDLVSGSLLSFNPNVSNNVVYSIDVYGSTVYIGGTFTTVGGQTRNRIAALDPSTGTPTSWNPDIGGSTGVAVYSLKVSSDGTKVYAGGYFNSVSSMFRVNFAEIDSSSGSPTTLYVATSSNVRTLVYSSSAIAIGGDFTSLGGDYRSRIASIDTTTGELTTFDGGISGTGTVSVNALAIYGNTLYAGGAFTTAWGYTRNRIAAFNLLSEDLIPWDGNSGGIVRTLLISGTTLYVGGEFTSMSGQTRNRLAAFDLTSGTLSTTFNPNMGGNVYALAYSSGVLYAGGAFTTVNGSTARNRIAALDPTTGTVTTWNPNLSGNARTIAVGGSTVYVGGEFTTVNGSTTRNRAAGFDIATGTATSFNPNVGGGTVYSLQLSSDGLYAYIAGAFTTIGGSAVSKIGLVNVAAGSLITDWSYPSDNTIYATYLSEPNIFVGGDLTALRGIKRPYYGALPLYGNNCSAGILLSTEPFATYQWYKDGVQINGATSRFYQADLPGLYRVDVTRSGGCSGTSADFRIFATNCSGGCTAPTQEVTLLNVNQDKSGFNWSAITADNYRTIRGIKDDLPSLSIATTTFDCYSYGPQNTLIISSDDPSGVSGRCYYYIVQGYNGTDPNTTSCMGPAGSGMTFTDIETHCQ
jgi:N-acetylneuraminic acid mutarotase